MSQEYQSLPGLEMGLFFTFFQKIQRGWAFSPAETDASFLFCIFKDQQGRENCCKNPGASSWDSSELSWKNTGRWFEHWRVRPGLLGARIWAQICKNTNEHWHHLRRGCWPPIIPAINHRVLLPNADRIRRGGKILSRPVLLSSNLWNTKPCSLLACGMWGWSALEGKGHSGTLIWQKKGSPSLGSSELLFSALWPFRTLGQ